MVATTRALGDVLARLHVPVDHDAGNRRLDHGVGQLLLREFEGGAPIAGSCAFRLRTVSNADW